MARGIKWSQVWESVTEHIFRIRCGTRMGTAWVFAIGVNDDRFFLGTARHVIQDFITRGEPMTLWREGAEDPFESERIRCQHNVELDMAVLEVKAEPPERQLGFRDANTPKNTVAVPKMGIEVAWFGYAETSTALFGVPTLTICTGVISAKGRLGPPFVCLIDGVVNKGMSGGPVVDAEGSALGMIIRWKAPPLVKKRGKTATLSPQAWPGFGIMVPATYILQALDEFDLK